MSSQVISEVSTTLAAGSYWVGDPCYAFNDQEAWMALLESANFRDNPRILNARTEEHLFVASGTAFGDGEFSDGEGRRYPVDAGLIGVTPARNGEEMPWGMNLIEFTEPFTVSYANGVISIGPVNIDTDGGW